MLPVEAERAVAGGLPEPERRASAAVVEELRGAGVRLVRILHPDLYGRARSKQLPLDRLAATLDGGLGYCEASLVENLRGTPLEGGDFPADRGFPDVHAVPDLRTARVVPWEPDAAWVIADVRDGAGPSPLCSRTVLRRACARAEAMGLEAVTAAEPEFYLLARGDGGPRLYSPGTGMAYTAGVRADPGGVLGRLQRYLLDLDIGVTSANREFSPGQFEVNLHHGPALAGGDHAFLLKEAVKEVAAAEGLVATFMAKPFGEHEGSSLHLHVSLWRDGRNAFAGPGHDGVAPACRAFVAGIQAHAPGLAAIGSPTVNSYKRTVPGGLAPVDARAAGDDRLAYVRIPSDRGGATRVEARGGDASANPYLLAAALLHAGLDGLERGLEPRDAGPPLPRTLDAAVAALEADDVLREGLGPALVATLAALRRDETARFAAAVTDWERDEYLLHA